MGSSSLLQQKLVIQEHREHLFAKSDNTEINQAGRTEGDPELGGWASLSRAENSRTRSRIAEFDSFR